MEVRDVEEDLSRNDNVSGKKNHVLERFFYSVVIMGVRRGVRPAKNSMFLDFFEFVFWCSLSKKYGKFCPSPHGKSLRTPMVVILQNKSIARMRTNKLQLL